MIGKRGGVSLLAVALLSMCCQQRPNGAGGVTVIEGATIIDGVSPAPLEDAVMVIEGESIRGIGKRGTVATPAGAEVIRANGKTIIPGIFGLHSHLGMSEGWERTPQNYSRGRIQRDANWYLYYGVTHVLSLGLDWEPMWGFRADQRAGKAGGARVYSAGLGFSAPGGWKPAGVEEINRPTTPEEARALVRKEIINRPDVIKIWLDDGQGQLPELEPEVYGAIIDEAHRHNVKVLAHLYALEDAKEMIRRGVDALAHSVRDREVDEEFLRLAREHEITQITTLVGHYGDLVWESEAEFLDDPGVSALFPPGVVERMRSEDYRKERLANPALARTRAQYETAAKNARRIAAAGIPIAVGTDSGSPTSFPGLWEHREIELLTRAGLTPMQAIQAATINGARFLGVANRFGSLEEGKAADFLILTANPLEDIQNTRKIEAVWMNGKPVDRSRLSIQTGSGAN